MLFTDNWVGVSDFCHHSPPGDNVGIYLLAGLFLMGLYRLEKTDEVLGLRVIMLDEGVETIGEIRAYGGVVVVSH